MISPRIALVLNELPLPTMSAAAKSYHAILKELARRGSNIDVLASGVESPVSRNALKAAYPDFHDRIRLFPPGHSVRWLGRLQNAVKPMSFQTGAALKAELRKIARDRSYDIVHFEIQWTARAMPVSLGSLPLLLGCHYFLRTDFAASLPASTLSDRISRRRLIAAENAIVRRFSDVRVLSKEMAETLALIHPGAAAHVVPLAIDPADYAFEEPPRKLPADPIVTMIGSMFWPPSLAAAERIVKRLWPRIRNIHPTARLRIVGRDARRHFEQFDGHDRIDVFENVPDILPFFREASVLLYAPPAGSGTKVKIQEAMLLGLPVVTNRSGAEGIAPRHGVEAMLGETDDELVAATGTLLTDATQGRQLAIAARNLVETRCGPGPVVDQLLATYGQVIENHRRTARP